MCVTHILTYTHTPSTFGHNAFMKTYFIVEQSVVTWLSQAFASTLL